MYAGMSKQQAGIKIRADFRSDTVTKPSQAMRAIMADAEVGDDVYEEDPNAILLQQTLAEMSGKEAALFFPTGTQSNLAALLSHCGRGEEIIIGDEYHICRDEAAGASVLGGIALYPLPTDAQGALTPEQVKDAIKPDDSHCAISRLLCLENTVSGKPQSQENIKALCRVAHENGLSVHLDGARIFNASVALEKSLKELCDPVDSVSICLSKGVGAPVGSILCGSKDLIRKAKRARKLLGGGMRQVGVLAACALYALEHNIDRLKIDHANAKHLAKGLSSISEIHVDQSKVETNMVFFDPGKGNHQPLCDHLHARGIMLGMQEPEIRLVTHLDVDQTAIDLMISEVRNYFSYNK